MTEVSVLLESTLQLEDLTNTLVADGKDKKIIYTGTMTNLRFKEDGLYGRVVLRKDEHHETLVEKKKTIFGTRTKYIPDAQRTIWVFDTEEYNKNRSTTRIIERGKMQNGYEPGSYRGILNISALNKGINISAALFDQVFHPLEERLVATYNAAMKKDDHETPDNA
ncbi:MAG: hypothetical protein V1725_03380 [archaeon]